MKAFVYPIITHITDPECDLEMQSSCISYVWKTCHVFIFACGLFLSMLQRREIHLCFFGSSASSSCRSEVVFAGVLLRPSKFASEDLLYMFIETFPFKYAECLIFDRLLAWKKEHLRPQFPPVRSDFLYVYSCVHTSHLLSRSTPNDNISRKWCRIFVTDFHL